jgi:hypothetical protein
MLLKIIGHNVNIKEDGIMDFKQRAQDRHLYYVIPSNAKLNQIGRDARHFGSLSWH